MNDSAWLISTWMRLLDQGENSIATRVPNSLPLAQYCAVDVEGNFVYYVNSKDKPETLPELSAVSVGVVQLKDGTWRRSLTLLSGDFFEEFSTLVQDLISASSLCQTERLALRAQTSTYENWIQFYEKRRGFSLEKARGLFGELFVLSDEMTKRSLDWDGALSAWVGPHGAPQDFVFSPDEAVEVKTINLSTKHIRISSAEQLTFDGRLELRVLKISAAKSEGVGESLNGLILTLTGAMGAKLALEFREMLAKAGFDKKSEYANDWFFQVLTSSTYPIDSNFPRITVNDLPSAVNKVEYQIQIRDIEGFKINN